MKTTLTLALSLLASSAFAGISYSNQADISPAHSNIRLADVRFVSLPSKTEVRQIPGCNPNGEISQVCTEVVVLESEPAVQATVTFRDGVSNDPENREGYLTLNLDPADFSAADLAALEGASQGRWDFGGRQARVRKSWAAKNLELSTALVTRTIQVVDTRNSRLCPVGEAGTTLPGCVEDIQYKPASTKVREVKISVK
ncbi:hypothetical protein ACJVC5_19325 [Peredibacter sp. HCB2-198]|uniref:hypothetical protein n=1 Tax=Peredibacter sp. HCB2-198 TaxID=3383025 RepID=UPI0038B5E25D